MNFYSKKYQFSQVTHLNQFLDLSKEILRRYLKDENSFHKIIDKQQKIILDLKKVFEKKLSNNLNDLLEILKKNQNWWSYCFLGEDKGKLVEEKVLKIIQEKEKNPKKIDELMHCLSTPSKPSLFIEERTLFYKICLAFLEKNNKLLDSLIKDYIEEFFYMKTTFHDRKIITKEYMLEKNSRRIKRRKAQ